MGKHYEKTLPDNYVEAYVLDMTEEKTNMQINIAGTLMSLAVILIGAVAVILKFKGHPELTWDNVLSWKRIGIYAVVSFAYIILHELTHGLAYKLLTREKLTYGFQLTVAYCGVPDIYVYRTAALIALLAPFAVFNLVFIPLPFLLANPADKIWAYMLLAGHIGGCVGDLYDTWLYLTKYRDPETLMRDTGPKQTFYLPGTEE